MWYINLHSEIHLLVGGDVVNRVLAEHAQSRGFSLQYHTNLVIVHM